MARFTFTIESEEEKEMSGLMARLFVHAAAVPQAKPAAPRQVAAEPAPADETADDEVTRRRRRTKAEIAADNATVIADAENDPVVPEEEELVEEVTLEMVKAAGSKAMGVIKASGVAAIFKSHGGGAESFGSLDPKHYESVYEALQASL